MVQFEEGFLCSLNRVETSSFIAPATYATLFLNVSVRQSVLLCVLAAFDNTIKPYFMKNMVV